MRVRIRALLVGLIGGGLGGLILLSWGVGLPWLGGVAIAVGAAAPPRPIGAIGAFIGWGATWLALLVGIQVNCTADPSCYASDFAPWIAASIGILAVGLLLGAVRLRGRRFDREPEGPEDARVSSSE
jgi:hypothetical protein